MEKIPLRDLRQYLEQRPVPELIDDILDLYKKFEIVQDYYFSQISSLERGPLIEKYKAIIRNEFFPERGFGTLRLSVAKRAISDFRKLSDNPAEVADLMLYYVEQGVEFTNAYGDISEAFYNSMESMYERAARWVRKYDLEEGFQDRFREVVSNTRDIGWGFHDDLSDMYDEYFGEAK